MKGLVWPLALADPGFQGWLPTLGRFLACTGGGEVMGQAVQTQIDLAAKRAT